MKKRFATLLLALLLCLSMLVGCGSKTEQSTTTEQKTEQETVAETSSEVKEEQTDTEQISEVKEETPETREFTDDLGRTVTIPYEVDYVMVMSPIGQIAVYTMDPNVLAGWVYTLSDSEKQFINPDYYDLPVLGGTYGGGNVLNPEVVVATNPDVLINMGDMYDDSAEECDSLQEQTGVPVVAIGLSSNMQGEYTIPEMYRMLGELLGQEERGEELASYCEKVLNDVAEKSQTIAEEDKVNVYYVEGSDGLSTEPPTSNHAQIFNMIGANNVADVEVGGRSGNSAVSLEQIIGWNPDLMVVAPNTVYDMLNEKTDASWNVISAVDSGRVYEIPAGPFNWFDRPPSVNRIMGVMWCANLVYPDVYQYDIVEETVNFYKTFYHVDITDEDIDFLLGNSTLKAGTSAD